MKIADFGLARGVHQIDYYKKTTNVSDSFSFKQHLNVNSFGSLKVWSGSWMFVKTVSPVLLVNMSPPKPGSLCMALFTA